MNKPVPPAEASKGHNRPPVLTPDELRRDFGYLDSSLAEIKTQVDGCPPVAEDDNDIDQIRTAVRKCMGAAKRLEALRVEAKEPFLSATRICDSHFNGLKDMVIGWQAGLEKIAKRLLDKRRAEEQATRDEAARVAAQDAREAAERARLAEQERIEREQATMAEAFANEPEVEAPSIANVAEARVEETRLRTEAIQKSADAMKAQEAANAKPADMVRVRSSDGISTLAEIWKFEVEDRSSIDFNAISEHFSAAHLETALQRYVDLNKGERPLKGIRIFSDTKVRMT